MIDELARAEGAVAACADAPAWALSEHYLIAVLDATHRLQQRLAAVQLAAVRELDWSRHSSRAGCLLDG